MFNPDYFIRCLRKVTGQQFVRLVLETGRLYREMVKLNELDNIRLI